MAKESTQTKLSRVRAPRVQISYEVNNGGAIELKELPFVMGVLGDFTGHPVQQLAEVKKREFVEITPDNFDDVLERMKPHLSYSVANTLLGEGSPKLKVDLHFKSLEDFSPEKVAENVPALKEMLAMRQRLSDLRGTLQTNEALDKALQDAIGNTEKINQLKAEVSGEGDKA